MDLDWSTESIGNANSIPSQILSALDNSNPDDIYEALTFGDGVFTVNKRGLLVRDEQVVPAEDEIYIRALSVIASQEESNRENTLNKINSYVVRDAKMTNVNADVTVDEHIVQAGLAEDGTFKIMARKTQCQIHDQ